MQYTYMDNYLCECFVLVSLIYNMLPLMYNNK